MSVSLDTKGSLVFRASGTGANGNSLTLSAPATMAADRVVTMVDPGAAATLPFALNGASVMGRMPVITAAAGANALTAAQSGSLVLLSTVGAGSQITLPAIAASAGVNFMLVLANSTAGANCLVNIDGTAADGVIGSVIVAGAEVAVTVNGSDSITFVSGTAVIGDQAYFYCTGAKWVVRALGDAAGGITVQN